MQRRPYTREHRDRRPPTCLHCTQRTAVTPWGPNDAPHSRQCECPSPHAVFLILSRRLERRLRAHAEGGERADANFAPRQKKNNKIRGEKKNKSSESVSICVWWTDENLCNGDDVFLGFFLFPPHPILSCSLLSIMAARARTPLMISFSSSVSSSPGGPPGAFIVHQLWKKARECGGISLHPN